MLLHSGRVGREIAEDLTCRQWQLCDRLPARAATDILIMMAPPPARTVHVVGSVPADSTKDALGLLREELGERLGPTVPDGQTGNRRNWIYRIVEGLRSHPALELVRDGAWSDYSDIPAFRVRKGRRLRWLDLDYFAALERSWPDFVEFNTGGNRKLQVGIPSPAGLAYVTFGMNPARAAPNLAAFHWKRGLRISHALVRYVEVDIIAMVRYRRLSAKGSVNESNKPAFPINTQTRHF